MSEDVKKTNTPFDFSKYLNVYEFESILPGTGETIKFRPITTGQLKKMLVYENSTNPLIVEKALDELITSSIITEGFSINKLYLQDRFFLLLEIRKKTKGEVYKFSYTCPSCRSQSLKVINLDELAVTPMPTNIDNIVRLDKNISVKLGFITRGEQISAYSNIKDINKITDSQRSTEMSILTHAVAVKSIITPDGETENISIPDKKYFLENIPTGMYEKIGEWFKEHDFGVDFTHTIVCHCGKEEKISIPVENFFF